MKKPTQVENTDWFSSVLNEHQKPAIPVGPRFQADVPEWNGPPQREYPHKSISKSFLSKWLGTVIWSNKDTRVETDRDATGKGRPQHCDCYNPGSLLCVKRHVTAKISDLQKDLGSAFQIWKFDEMGEAVAKSWKHSEQQKFARVVETNLISEGNNFIKLALGCFPSKSHNTIVSYYFNVYLPRKISIKTRSGCASVDSDKEEEKTTPCSKGSRKRAHVDNVSFPLKIARVAYLGGRR